MKRALSTFMFVLLLVGMFTFAFNTRNVKASGTIYIRADGSVDPPTAPIQRDGDYYTLTGNMAISSYEYGIVIERNNMTLDGAGYTVQGIGTTSFGIVCESSNNVTIRNTNINNLARGIVLYSSSNNSISGNNITNNEMGICFSESSNNNISENSITANSAYGIYLGDSSNNSISGNNITNNGEGVGLNSYSCNNTISGNNITNNGMGIDAEISSNYNSVVGNNITNNSYEGIYLCLSSSNSILVNNIANNDLGIELYNSSNNSMFHNYFINNTRQIYDQSWEKPFPASINFWDDGYPSGGNYWSDYNSTDLHNGQFQNETGGDGIGDSPYIIDVNNQDNYPLMHPWVPYENGTVYIRDDGSVDPSGAPILRKGDLYTLTDNVTSNADGIVIERNNMILDGEGYTVQGLGWPYLGIYMSGRTNVTIMNVKVKAFYYGISLSGSSNSSIVRNNMAENGYCILLSASSNYNSIVANNVTDNGLGIWLAFSSDNNVEGNNIANSQIGVEVYPSSNHNSIFANNIANNNWGILLSQSSNNSISRNNIANSSEHGIIVSQSSNYHIYENNITNNYHGISIDHSSNQYIYHNNFVNNVRQVYYSVVFMNEWDDGYPSGGNYWSDYTGVDLYSGPYQNETGSDGMGDMPYLIDADNQDNYPLMNPWPSGWKLDFTVPTNHPIVDFAVCNGSLYAAADSKLYVKDGGIWNVIDAPTFVTSLESFGGKLVVGGQGGLYCYDGASFSQIFSVPTYIRVLGVYDNRLYAGTMLDKPPKLYYCNGSADNPADWHLDSGFSSVLNFSGAFGSIDSFWASDNNVGSPVGYWKFDEGAGSVAFDSSGNNFDGTVNGANWTDGVLNKALEFDGQDDYVEVLDSAELNPPAITVAAWVNFKGFPEPGENGWRNSVIASKGTDVLVDGNYVLFTCAQFVDGAHMYFQITEQGQYTYVGGNTIIIEDEWYYAVGTYDGSVLRVYVNGVLDGEAVLNTQRTSNTENLQIGAMRMLGNGYWTNGTIDEVKIYGYAKTPEEIWNDYLSGIGNMYVASGNSVYCYDGTNWSVAVSYDDVSAFLAMKSYDGKLYLATRDQGWRKPLYQGGTGFSGRVIGFDGENWTTVLDYDYWIYSLGVYDGKLYAGTANRILTYNGTDWETSFNATEGAYYAISMINYDGKIYAGMGNGYIFADPAPPKAVRENIVVPEFPQAAFFAVFAALTVLSAVSIKKKHPKKTC